MSKIETMRTSAKSAPQLKELQTIADLQTLINSLEPKEIESAMLRVRETAAIYGELIAQQIVPVIEPLQQLIQQAQDSASALNDSLQKVNTAPKEPSTATVIAKALEPIQQKLEQKDPMYQALPWLLLVNMVISLGTLAMVLLRA